MEHKTKHLELIASAIEEDNPASLLHIKSTDNGSSDHSAYGHPVTGGQNGALYIDKSNSRIDWQDGIVFAGEGTSWSMRVTGRNGLVTDSDTNGEIFGVHPVEGSGTTWNDTAGADSVTAAYLRVMGNGKTTLVKNGIAKAIGRPFAFITLGGCSDASFLEGHNYTYEGSMWGKIVDVLMECKCMNPVFYFDELDKVSETTKGDEINAS